ncbi:MAG: polyphosphate kinase 2 family protein [Burkholderiaceae bacterium]
MKRCWLTLGRKDHISELDASATPGWRGGAARARKQTDGLRDQLLGLQERLFAESRQKLLVVLQAMDTGGKDGTIRRVFSGVNPNGIRVVRFGRPSELELAHDYLWRAHARVPERGQIVIFNRSHYEDVLVVRVNSLVPEQTWRRRYAHIRDFERMLVDEGTTILKFYLHIDRDEQRERLQARLDEPSKNWKFDEHDLVQRRKWDDYMLAFEDAIRETHTDEAPWYIIPANRKWFRDWAVMSILVDALGRMDPQYPKPDFDPGSIRVE